MHRTQSVVQEGKFVADVLYYYGDHVPNVFPHKHADPAGVMPGFDYDVTDERIKYYSGTAVYNKAFNIDFEPEKVKQYFLTLGSVKDVGIAEVKMNEKKVWPFLTGEQKAAKDRSIYWKTRQAFAVREGYWKLLVHQNTSKVELYNLENDFREKSDISESNPEKVKYLCELLEKIKCSIQTCSVMT